ncbi:hypothetical protein KSS87_004359 [Heliosperma pusillum]|nr:hypothetical protein KSS87_004359 [Heliosperma pusillum]
MYVSASSSREVSSIILGRERFSSEEKKIISLTSFDEQHNIKEALRVPGASRKELNKLINIKLNFKDTRTVSEELLLQFTMELCVILEVSTVPGPDSCYFFASPAAVLFHAHSDSAFFRLLMYEDGYYDNNVLQLRSQSILRGVSGQEEVRNIGFGTALIGEAVPDCDIALADDVISCRQYLIGQGIIGKVALSGDDLWLYSDDAESTELPSYLEHHPDEWLLPGSAGIKTTLIVPILPYGVLQLGSFIKVAENFGNVTDIKETVFSVMSTTIYLQSNYGEPPLLWSSMTITEWEENDNSSLDLVQRRQFQIPEELDKAEYVDTEISTGYEFIDPLQLDDIITNSLLTSEVDICHLYMDLTTESDALNDYAIPDISEALENMWTFSCLEEEYVDIGFSSESSSGVSSYVSPEQEQQSPATDLQEANRKNDEHSTCSFEANVDSSEGLFPTALSSCGWFDEGVAHDYLLEAAVATLYKSSDDPLSLLYNNSSRSTETSLSELAPSFQVQPSYEIKAALTEHHTTVLHEQCTSLSRLQSTAFNNTLILADTLESIGSAIFKEEKPRSCKSEFPHKNEKISKHNKGRNGSKNNLRPRPRDRQLIQDRLKQLRKLVPSATKTSIDGLLEQTTKHMVFLRSVTEQAKKVKQFTNQKLIADKTEAHTRHPGRTSFRSQLGGNNTESCPIIVTDMEHQGQFLIQMLCNTDEVFFEMIEVMRQLKLSILQGVMEDHRNNWAYFIVEASDGFNKLDIFWPLMRILQQNGDWITKMNQWCI